MRGGLRFARQPTPYKPLHPVESEFRKLGEEHQSRLSLIGFFGP
jgi:hypothetical protein